MRLVGYADDVALVAQNRSWNILPSKLAQSLDMVVNWLNDNHLQLAPEKMESITIRYGRPPKEMNISILGQPIRQSRTLKYLGITLNVTARFGPHIRSVAAKTEAAVKALSRLMPNVVGPGEKRRRVLGLVAQSIMLYDAPVWANVMGVEIQKDILECTAQGCLENMQGIQNSFLRCGDDGGVLNTHTSFSKRKEEDMGK